MSESRGWRYGSTASRKEYRIPAGVHVAIAIRGTRPYEETIDGRYYFRLTPSHLEIIDPAGAGVVCMFERGLVGRVEISAV